MLDSIIRAITGLDKVRLVVLADVRLRRFEIGWSQNSDPQEMSLRHDDLHAAVESLVHQL